MPQYQTPFYGRDSGHPFSLYPYAHSSIVKVLEMWSGWGSGDANGHWVIKGIQLTWFTGEQKGLYNHPVDTDVYSRYEFGGNEMANFSIRAGWRIHKFGFQTSTGILWDAGGDSGHLFLDIANGSIVGFEGSSGWELDYLRMRFI